MTESKLHSANSNIKGVIVPLVSVIVPTYNRVKLLSETVNSILSQTFDDFELIIVDNMSDDGTYQYVKNIPDSRVKYFRNANNGIIAVSRNVGIRNARGKYVAFCDDDDLWLPDKLESQIVHFDNNNICCVSSNFSPIGEVLSCYNLLIFKKNERYHDYSYKDIALTNFVITSSAIARKELLQQESGFDENPDFKCIEDWDLWLRLSAQGYIRVIAKPLILYRVCINKSRNMQQISLNTLKIFEKHRNLGYMDKKICKIAQGNSYVTIGRAFFNANDRGCMKYFMYGFFYSSGIHNKIRALCGLLLYFIPISIRSVIVNRLHMFRNAVM